MLADRCVNGNGCAEIVMGGVGVQISCIGETYSWVRAVDDII